jgi:hypothetical protein
MLIGAQIKEGGNGRGLFSDCCEYPVIKQFCNKHEDPPREKYDGIILTDNADTYLFSGDKSIPLESRNRLLPPELWADTQIRRNIDRIAMNDIIEGRAFPYLLNSLIKGAMYPEFVIIGDTSEIFKILYTAPMSTAYTSGMIDAYTVNTIPHCGGFPWVIQPPIQVNPNLISRQENINAVFGPTIIALPYLFNQDDNLFYHKSLIDSLVPLYITPNSKRAEEGGSKTKRYKRKRNTKKNKRRKLKIKSIKL